MSMDLDPRLQQMLRRIPQQRVVVLLTLFLLFWIAWQLARITWLLVPAPMSSGRWQAAELPSTVTIQTLDIDTLASAGLFGKAAQENNTAAAVQVIDAPETKLQLTLTGVVANTQTGGGAAIIESAGDQETYSPGDRIKQTSATVKQILPDRVIIANRGIAETLMLDGFDYSKASATVYGSREDSVSRQEVKSVLNQLDDVNEPDDVQRLTDYIRVSPVQQDGKLIGFRVNPGRDQKWFESSGLQPNDLAVSLNGIDLTDQQQAMKAVQELADMQDVSVMVERDGQLYDVHISLTE